jgi:hypothetical protein
MSVCFSGILNSSTSDFAQRPLFLLGLQPLDANSSAGTKHFFALFYTQLPSTLSSVTNNPMIGSDKPFKSTREGQNPLQTLRLERQIVFQLLLREWDSKFP